MVETPGLYNWLRKKPTAVKVEYKLGDDWRPVAMPTGMRSKWKQVEANLRASGGSAARATDGTGAERFFQLDAEEEEYESNEQAKHAVAQSAALSREHTQLAHVLDRYADRLNQAYEKGAAAANTGQENLLDVVQLLTNQWSVTMQSLHNVSMNLANVLIKMGGGEPAEQGDPNGAMMQQVLGMAAAKMMGMQGSAPVAADAKKNGKG